MNGGFYWTLHTKLMRNSKRPWSFSLVTDFPWLPGGEERLFFCLVSVIVWYGVLLLSCSILKVSASCVLISFTSCLCTPCWCVWLVSVCFSGPLSAPLSYAECLCLLHCKQSAVDFVSWFSPALPGFLLWTLDLSPVSCWSMYFRSGLLTWIFWPLPTTWL